MKKTAWVFAGALAVCGVIAAAGIEGLRAQDKTPGLTGIDHPDDVIMARQALMDGLEDEMMTIEIAPAGQEPSLSYLKASAFRINTLLMAFPHLFPPQTKPGASADATPSICTSNSLSPDDQAFPVSPVIARNASSTVAAPADLTRSRGVVSARTLPR